jgi:hypothetical protein
MMQKQLRKPSNWQDFESLCEILWGEIWNYPEIKKNGRSGQNQFGIDIIGKFNGDYIGIQCKGKDEALGTKLTKQEIDDEVNKALSFKPALKKMYFATTADKDVGVEEYVRLKSEGNEQNGLFEIHLFSWGDIVSLIDRNKKTHDYYVNSQYYQSNVDIDFTFKDGCSRLEVDPKRHKYIHHTVHTPIRQPELPNALKQFVNPEVLKVISAFEKLSFPNRSNKVNKSYINFSFRIINNGNSPITNYKIEFEFRNGISDLQVDRVFERDFPRFGQRNFQIKKIARFTWQIIPRGQVLVPTDKAEFNSFSVKPVEDKGTLKVYWKLLSSELTKEGSLSIDFEFIDMVKRTWDIVPADQQEQQEITFKDYFEIETEDYE